MMDMPIPNPAVLARKAQIVAALSAVLPTDAVLSDPAETRAWLLRGLNATPPAAPRQGKKRPFVDTW